MLHQCNPHRMQTAKGRRVQQLRKQHDRQQVRQHGGQTPAQHTQQQTDQHDVTQAELPQQTRHEDKQQNLGHHPQRPEQTDLAARIPQVLHHHTVEGVVGSVTELHQKTDGKKSDHLWLAQDGPDRGTAITRQCRSLGTRGNGQRIEPDQQHQPQHHPGQHGNADEVQQPSDQYHCKYEAYRAPDTNTTVAGFFLTQIAEGYYFELGQHRVPEKAEARHYQRYAKSTGLPEYKYEDQPGRQCSETNDSYPLSGSVGEPAPQIGRYDT